MRRTAIWLAAGAVALLAPAAAQAAKTHYSGSFDEAQGSAFSFDVVKKQRTRTVRNVEFTGVPTYCSDGGMHGLNGSSNVKAKVGKDLRFVGTSYSEVPGGFIVFAQLRGEFRQNRAIAAGRLILTSRMIGAGGFVDCSSGFAEFTVARQP